MSSVPPPGRSSTTTVNVEKVFEEPADANIPDNYVSWTLKNQKALPPVRWDNLLQELNWLNVSILSIPPLLALYGVTNVRLRWETALFAVFYYFVTGLGTSRPICYGAFAQPDSRYHRRLPSPLGSQVLQRIQAIAVLLRHGRSWSC